MGKIIEKIELSKEDKNKFFDNSGLFQEKEVFSGTDTCKCNGKVIYNCKRSDGAELGACNDCGKQYIDYKGNRLPSVFSSQRYF